MWYKGQSSCFYYGCSIAPVPFVEETIPSPLNYYSWISVKTVGPTYVRLFLDSLFCFISVYPSTNTTLSWLLSCIMSLKSWLNVSSYFILFVRIVLAILVPLSFRMKFRLTLSKSRKHLTGILIEMKSVLSIGDIWQFFCVLQIHESLCLFRSSLISFISVL